jgi:hypothetical protein
MNKKQMTDFCKSLGSHFAAVSNAHSDLAATCEEDSPAQKSHQSIATSCGDMAEKCLACLKVLVNADYEKVFERNYSQLVPMNISVVTPTAPGITAVPRPGQPPAASVPNVAPEFQNVFAIDDEKSRRKLNATSCSRLAVDGGNL